MPSADAQHLIRTTQHALDDINDFSAHHLRLMLADSPLQPNVSQQVISDGTSIHSDDKDVALVVRLIAVETGATPRSHLQTYTTLRTRSLRSRLLAPAWPRSSPRNYTTYSLRSRHSWRMSCRLRPARMLPRSRRSLQRCPQSSNASLLAL